MKTITILTNIFMLILLFSINLDAQQQYDPTAVTQEIDYKIDKLGDARLELRQKMTASQWQNFKASAIARNPSIFKRDMERSMTAIQIEDFRNEMNEETRSSVTQLTARSVAIYKGKGKWEFKVGTKNPNVTQISDNIYLFSNNLVSGGGIIQQLQKVFFPAQASNIKQGTDAYGNAIFTYTLNVEGSSFNFLMFLGIALILAGLAWKFVPQLTAKQN